MQEWCLPRSTAWASALLQVYSAHPATLNKAICYMAPSSIMPGFPCKQSIASYYAEFSIKDRMFTALFSRS